MPNRGTTRGLPSFVKFRCFSPLVEYPQDSRRSLEGCRWLGSAHASSLASIASCEVSEFDTKKATKRLDNNKNAVLKLGVVGLVPLLMGLDAWVLLYWGLKEATPALAVVNLRLKA